MTLTSLVCRLACQIYATDPGNSAPPVVLVVVDPMNQFGDISGCEES